MTWTPPVPRRRIITLHRVMYESFTPGMMRKTPLWLKRKIATTLQFTLVDKLTPDQFIRSFCTAEKGAPAPMGIKMFEDCVGGTSTRKFFTWKFWRDTIPRIARGETHTAKQRQELQKLTTPKKIEMPGGIFPPVSEYRRRLP